MFFSHSRSFAVGIFLIALDLHPQLIGDHGDKFGIGRFAAAVLNRIAEISIQSIYIAAIPCHFDGVADSAFHSGRSGPKLLATAG